jgi:hypothetical protein
LNQEASKRPKPSDLAAHPVVAQYVEDPDIMLTGETEEEKSKRMEEWIKRKEEQLVKRIKRLEEEVKKLRKSPQIPNTGVQGMSVDV